MFIKSKYYNGELCAGVSEENEHKSSYKISRLYKLHSSHDMILACDPVIVCEVITVSQVIYPCVNKTIKQG